MADWTLTAGHYPRPYRSAFGSPRIRHFQESTAASTATIKLGHLVSNDTVVSTGGFRISRSPAGYGTGTNLAGSTNCLGFAAEASTSDGSTTGLGVVNARMLPVWLADEYTEFKGWLKGSGPAATSLVGTLKAIIFDSTLNTYFIDSTNSTAALLMVRITDVPQDSAGDTNGPVIFKFLPDFVSPAV